MRFLSDFVFLVSFFESYLVLQCHFLRAFFMLYNQKKYYSMLYNQFCNAIKSYNDFSFDVDINQYCIESRS